MLIACSHKKAWNLPCDPVRPHGSAVNSSHRLTLLIARLRLPLTQCDRRWGEWWDQRPLSEQKTIWRKKMEGIHTEREEGNDWKSCAFVLSRINTWVMRREENKWTVLVGERREGDEKEELAPFLLFFLAWHSDFWQNVSYPLHMGNPAEKHTHTRSRVKASPQTLRGFSRQGAFSPLPFFSSEANREAKIGPY